MVRGWGVLFCLEENLKTITLLKRRQKQIVVDGNTATHTHTHGFKKDFESKKKKRKRKSLVMTAWWLLFSLKTPLTKTIKRMLKCPLENS